MENIVENGYYCHFFFWLLFFLWLIVGNFWKRPKREYQWNSPEANYDSAFVSPLRLAVIFKKMYIKSWIHRGGLPSVEKSGKTLTPPNKEHPLLPRVYWWALNRLRRVEPPSCRRRVAGITHIVFERPNSSAVFVIPLVRWTRWTHLCRNHPRGT